MNSSELINLNTGKTEWTTPADFFTALDSDFHFTLDPCSTHENALCEKHFTIAEDGLKQDWSGEIVYMNPPYNAETGKWIQKAYEESMKGATVVCLIPGRPDAKYWHDYIFPYAANIQFIRGRLKFSNSKNSASFPSAIVVFHRAMRGRYRDMSYRKEK